MSAQVQDSPSAGAGGAGAGPTPGTDVAALERKYGPVDTHTTGPARVHRRMMETVMAGANTAFAVVDLGHVQRQYNRWVKLLPRIRPFYAVKCNPDPRIISTLHAAGAGFDCASLSEIEAALGAGADPSVDVIYANPCKAPAHLEGARDKGVDLVTLDCIEELYKLHAIHPRARCVVRLLVDDSASSSPLGVKFGAAMDDVPHIFRVASELKLQVVGVSFHIGSGSRDPNAFKAAITLARNAFDLAIAAGHTPTLLDVGGGFPHDRKVFAAAAKGLSAAVDAMFPADSGVTVIGEPGRFFAAGSHTLATPIIGRRVKTQPDGEQHAMLFLADGLYGSFNCVVFDHVTPQPKVLVQGTGPLAKQLQAPVGGPTAVGGGGDTVDGGEGGGTTTSAPAVAPVSSSLWGPTCDGIDVIVKKTQELPDLHPGDWLWWEHWGAYTLSSGSRFNGFDLPKQVYLEVDSADMSPPPAVAAQ